MKYLIFLLSAIYLTAATSCKTEADSHDHQHPGQDENTHVHQHPDHDETVNNHQHTEQAEHETHSDGDHTIMKVEKQKFRFMHKTSGQIITDKKDEIIITATGNGIVRFINHSLLPGVEISSGQHLFGIFGENLTEGNTSINYINVQAEFETAKSNYSRAKKLIGDKLITSEHFLSVKKEFIKAEALYNVYKQNLNTGGSVVSAPYDCYIKDIYVAEGQKVEPGDKLASVIIENRLILKADVAPSDLDILKLVEEASFITSYSTKIYSTGEMNGSKISFGKSTGKNSFYIPVYFRIDYDPELIPGTFAEVWLLGPETNELITIPNSAIMEEYGKYYLFIEKVSGEFEKRYIIPGRSDGEVTEILKGLHAGEDIVATGAYQVKMSMMTSIPNTHDHNH